MARLNRINISNLRSVFNKKYRVNSIEFDMKFNKGLFEPLYAKNYYREINEELFDTYHKCFDELIYFIKDVQATHTRDFVGIKFRLPDSDDGVPFGLPFVELRQLSSTIITDLLLKVQQSNSSFKSTEKIEIVITIVERADFVGNRSALAKINLEDYSQLCENKKRSILIPYNEHEYDDNKCLPRALVIGMEWESCNHKPKLMRKLLVKTNSTLLKKKTNQLIKKTFGSDAVHNFKNKFTLSDVVKFNNVLKSYQITVYDDVNQHKKILYRSNQKCKKKIDLFYLSNMEHCLAIANVNAFFGTGHYCKLCHSPQSSESHKCTTRCSSCFHSPKCVKKEKKKTTVPYNVHCADCNRYFKNKKCYENHLKVRKDEKYTVCKQYRICKTCGTYYDYQQLQILNRNKDTEKNHVCGQRYCFYCSCFVSELHHYCNIKVYTKQKIKKFMLCFYDIETVQKKPVENKKTKRVLKNLDEQKQVLEYLIESGKEEDDNEARQSYYKIEQHTETQFLHEPILLICQLVCYECYLLDFKNRDCDRCGKSTFVYEGENCIKQFLNMILNYKANITKICCISHNFKSFDGQLLVASLLKIPNNNINIVQNGNKILKVEVKGYISFIDSLSFLPMALAKFQETFSLDIELTKGFFPFRYLSYSNWNDFCRLPAKDQFGIDTNDTKNSKVISFLKWYDEQPTENYNIRSEAIKYCTKDVTILREGCIKFMKIILDIGDINPFLECVTLAQLALTVYRKKFMKRNTLGKMPENNYHMNSTQSRLSKRWLTYLNYFKCEETKQKYFIKSEVKLPDLNRFIVDGFCKNYPFDKSKSSKGTIFEGFGCYWHGCKKCNKTSTYQIQDKFVESNMAQGMRKKEKSQGINAELYNGGFLMRQRYQSTLAKVDLMKKLGYNVITVWEHEFLNFLNKNKDLAKRIEAHPSMQDKFLDPYLALKGGRNESNCFYKICGPNERMLFYDYNSLYPYIMLTAPYFLRSPKKILRAKECESIKVNDIMNMNGLAYVTVLCQQNLYWPVLPIRHNKKLYFVCCQTCLVMYNTEKCKHNVMQRALTDVWSTCELKVAFKNGYRLLKTHELWYYDVETGLNSINIPEADHDITYDELRERVLKHENLNVDFDGKNIFEIIDMQQEQLKKTDGLFTEYLNTFIKMKAEASGFPFGCVTQAQKEKYIVDFYKENNVILRMENIEYNPSKRAYAKLMMNALFGKLIQREKSMNKTVLKDPSDLQFYLNSDLHEVTDIYIPNDNYVMVSWRYKEDEETGKPINPSPIHESKANNRHVCLVSGIQTTTNARLRLYSEISKLKESLKYFDTDSLLFVKNETNYCPKLSNKIGGLANELERYRKFAHIDPWIDEFVCIAPKTYAYSVINDDTPDATKAYVVKCKGFHITSENSDKINFESMKSFVLGKNYSKEDSFDNELFYLDSILTTREKIITKPHYSVVTGIEKKKLSPTYDKRIWLSDHSTVPWGYVD